jgi:hypothetical protein
MAELRPWIENTKPGPDSFSGRNTRRTGSLIARSPKCRSLVMHPLVLATCGRFLGHAASYQLHLTQVIAIGPQANRRSRSIAISGPLIFSVFRKDTRFSATPSGR